MTVRSRGSITRPRPRRSLAAPVPPASAVIFMPRLVPSVFAAGEGGAGAPATGGGPPRGGPPPPGEARGRPAPHRGGRPPLPSPGEPGGAPPPARAPTQRDAGS